VSLTGGDRPDVIQLMPLLDAIPHLRGTPGRPRHRPGRLFADRGHGDDTYRRLLRARGIPPKIACKGITHGSGPGRTRRGVDRTFARLHRFERPQTRYAIRADLRFGGYVHFQRQRFSIGWSVIPVPRRSRMFTGKREETSPVGPDQVLRS